MIVVSHIFLNYICVRLYMRVCQSVCSLYVFSFLGAPSYHFYFIKYFNLNMIAIARKCIFLLKFHKWRKSILLYDFRAKTHELENLTVRSILLTITNHHLNKQEFHFVWAPKKCINSFINILVHRMHNFFVATNNEGYWKLLNLVGFSRKKAILLSLHTITLKYA